MNKPQKQSKYVEYGNRDAGQLTEVLANNREAYSGDKRQTPLNKAPLATSEIKNFLCLYVPDFNLGQGYKKK